MGGAVRVLALEIAYRGFSFAVLEGSERLIDWGVKAFVGDTSVFLAKLSQVIDRYRPDVLVLEEPAGSRKGSRAKEHMAWAEQLAVERVLRVVAIPRCAVTKDDRATETARLFPELAPKLPPRRKRWESESRGIAQFVAVDRGLEALKHLERRSVGAS